MVTLGVSECKFFDLSKVEERRGNLTFIEGASDIPFDIKRVFYVYDIPSGAVRGAHAHHELEEIVVCLSGSLDIVVNDGKEKRVLHLNRPYIGLYLPPMIWSNFENFDVGTIYLVLASTHYDASDYIRDYDEFLQLANGGKG